MHVSVSTRTIFVVALCTVAAPVLTAAQTSNCAPYICPSGKTHPSCTADGHVINYFIDPCQADVIGSFGDVPADSPFVEAITYLRTNGYAQGYSDNTFRPSRNITRAEFLKLMISMLRAVPDKDACRSRSPFSDVPASAWFAPYVCVSKDVGIVKGNPDGTFQPGEKINLAEASTMLAKALGIEITQDTPWYKSAVLGVAAKKAIPSSLRSVNERVTRGEVAEMLWRLKENIPERPAANGESLLTTECEWVDEQEIPGVDMDAVRRAWLGWNNETRTGLRLAPYTIEPQLERTAVLWSQHARSLGSISHKRTANAAYYDYSAIEQWFKKLDVTFKNVSSATFTENIGWGYYRCSKQDCTQDFINAIRTTYDFFLSEKGKDYRPHYNSLVKPEFTQIGLGVVVDGAGKYYLTVHYGTQITSDPGPVCP